MGDLYDIDRKNCNQSTRDIALSSTSQVCMPISDDQVQAITALKQIADFYGMGIISDDKGNRNTASRDIVSSTSSRVCTSISEDKVQAIGELKKITDLNDIAKLPHDKAQALAELEKIADFYDIAKCLNDEVPTRDITSLGLFRAHEVAKDNGGSVQGSPSKVQTTREVTSLSSSCTQILHNKTATVSDVEKTTECIPVNEALVPFNFGCSCGFNPNSEAALEKHLDRTRNRQGHARVDLSVDLELEAKERLDGESRMWRSGAEVFVSKVEEVVHEYEQIRLQGLQEAMAQSRDVDISDQTESEDNLTKAKRWLERNKAQRLKKKAFQAEKITEQEQTWEMTSISRDLDVQEITSRSRDLADKTEVDNLTTANARTCFTQQIASRSRDLDVPGNAEVDHSTNVKRRLTQEIMSRQITSRKDLDVPDKTKVDNLTNSKRRLMESISGDLDITQVDHSPNAEKCLAQETASRSRDLDVPDRTEVDHSTNAKRWLERNRMERFGNKEEAPTAKKADAARKFDKQTSVKHTVDSEVASWLAELHKSLGLVVVCQRKDLTTVASTNDKLANRLEDLRSYGALRPGLNWGGNYSPAKLQGGKWEDLSNLQVAREVRREAAILLTLGIERVYGSTMLGFSR